jgi:hypothetical protein
MQLCCVGSPSERCRNTQERQSTVAFLTPIYSAIALQNFVNIISYIQQTHKYVSSHVFSVVSKTTIFCKLIPHTHLPTFRKQWLHLKCTTEAIYSPWIRRQHTPKRQVSIRLHDVISQRTAVLKPCTELRSSTRITTLASEQRMSDALIRQLSNPVRYKKNHDMAQSHFSCNFRWGI